MQQRRALVKIRVSQRSSKDAVSNNFYQIVRRTQRNQQSSEQRVDTEQSWRDFVLELAIIMSNSPKYDLRNANIGNLSEYVQGDQKTIQHIHTQEQRQTLAEAAEEIQKLLEQLEKNKPGATEVEKVAYVSEKTTSAFKDRVVGALQAGGEAAIDEFLKNPYVKVGKAIVKAWLKKPE